MKRYKRWEKMSDRTVNSHIRGLRYVFEIVDKVGTQELREPLITIKRPHSKKNPYIPTDEELARVPELLKKLRESRREDYQYLAFIAATVLQFCGRTNALSELRFDMVEGLEEGEKPIVSYIGKHRVGVGEGDNQRVVQGFPKRMEGIRSTQVWKHALLLSSDREWPDEAHLRPNTAA